MKTKNVFLAILMSGSIILAACNGSATRPASTTGEQIKIVYTCPMDTQVVQDKPGKCPICGMNLVKKEIQHSASDSVKKD